MVAVWTSLLMSVAEISNLFTVVGVLICFLCMTVFIVRLQDENFVGSSVVHVSQPPVYRVDVQKVLIPFCCSLGGDNETDATELHVKVHSDCDFKLFVFWKVAVRDVWRKIYLPFSSFSSNLEDSTLLEATEAEAPRVVEVSPKRPHLLKLVVKDHSCRGPPPRSSFPLVLILSQIPKEDEPQGREVGAVIAVIHTADSECPMKTCILYQFLKQYSGHVSRLKPLYTQKEAPEEAVPDIYVNPSSGDTLCADSVACDGVNKTVQSNVTGSHLDHRNFMENLTDGRRETVGVKEAQYFSSLDGEHGNSEFTDGDSFLPDEACIVCQVAKTTRALLPCRHVCTCSTCFQQLDTCPLCRTRIQAYFVTDEAEDVRQECVREKEIETQPLPPPMSFLERLNHLIGLN